MEPLEEVQEYYTRAPKSLLGINSPTAVLLGPVLKATELLRELTTGYPIFRHLYRAPGLVIPGRLGVN